MRAASMVRNRYYRLVLAGSHNNFISGTGNEEGMISYTIILASQSFGTALTFPPL